MLSILKKIKNGASLVIFVIMMVIMYTMAYILLVFVTNVIMLVVIPVYSFFILPCFVIYGKGDIKRNNNEENKADDIEKNNAGVNKEITLKPIVVKGKLGIIMLKHADIVWDMFKCTDRWYLDILLLPVKFICSIILVLVVYVVLVIGTNLFIGFVIPLVVFCCFPCIAMFGNPDDQVIEISIGQDIEEKNEDAK